jgi:alpha-D-xyloside xylohydrolase
MLGDSLLVAPVFNDGGDVDYYLPEGDWVNFLTNAVVTGGRWVKENHDFFSLPLLLRQNSIIAVGNQDNKPEYDYGQNVTLHLGSLQKDQTAYTKVYSSEGELELSVSISRQADTLTINAQGTGKPWQLIWRTVDSVDTVENGKAEKSPLGAIIKPKHYSGEITVWL